MSPRRYSWKRPLNKKKRPKEDTEGESFNQPNNHSKLTDSNNCILFVVFISNYYCFSITPLRPVSSSGRSCHKLLVCVPRHVTHVIDISARGLFVKEFRKAKNAFSEAKLQCFRGLKPVFAPFDAYLVKFLLSISYSIQYFTKFY